MNFIMDESQEYLKPSKEVALHLMRMKMQGTSSGGWFVGERFNDRYDTEVGGNQLVITQGIDENGDFTGGIKTEMSLDEFSQIPKQERPPQIVDYETGDRYSHEDAKCIPELKEVFVRLVERIEEYEERKK